MSGNQEETGTGSPSLDMVINDLGAGSIRLVADAIPHAISALRELKALRGESERPRVTLEEMAHHIQRGFTAAGACEVLPCPKCSAAFDVLRKLAAKGGELLSRHLRGCACDGCRLVLALGVEPLR